MRTRNHANMCGAHSWPAGGSADISRPTLPSRLAHDGESSATLPRALRALLRCCIPFPLQRRITSSMAVDDLVQPEMLADERPHVVGDSHPLEKRQ